MSRWYQDLPIFTSSKLTRSWELGNAIIQGKLLTNFGWNKINPKIPIFLDDSKQKHLRFLGGTGWRKTNCRFVDWFFPHVHPESKSHTHWSFVRSIPLSECQVTFQHLGISPKWCYKTAVSRLSEIWAPQLTEVNGCKGVTISNGVFGFKVLTHPGICSNSIRINLEWTDLRLGNAISQCNSSQKGIQIAGRF